MKRIERETKKKKFKEKYTFLKKQHNINMKIKANKEFFYVFLNLNKKKLNKNIFE
jgi:hypothetical protein